MNLRHTLDLVGPATKRKDSRLLYIHGWYRTTGDYARLGWQELVFNSAADADAWLARENANEVRP